MTLPEYKSHAELQAELATCRQKLEAAEREAALYHANSDAYQGLPAEGQLGRKLLEWAANNYVKCEPTPKCIFCDGFGKPFNENIKHADTCLHLAAKQWQAVAATGRGARKS